MRWQSDVIASNWTSMNLRKIRFTNFYVFQKFWLSRMCKRMCKNEFLRSFNNFVKFQILEEFHKMASVRCSMYGCDVVRARTCWTTSWSAWAVVVCMSDYMTCCWTQAHCRHCGLSTMTGPVIRQHLRSALSSHALHTATTLGLLPPPRR